MLFWWAQIVLYSHKTADPIINYLNVEPCIYLCVIYICTQIYLRVIKSVRDGRMASILAYKEKLELFMKVTFSSKSSNTYTCT